MYDLIILLFILIAILFFDDISNKIAIKLQLDVDEEAQNDKKVN